ncbi:hypothetical protein B0T26DRAFT_675841 [Lasiosphaeria miniovina]|uniref:F-box domain-containing protein n=1 Tax=Lasiosphaeria miniovina TaxID=1954250 RepID=A0AA40AKJ9_9PEZI|nr:uncharacterized protein B0T26DRAFT_675841 [Lasiosphaeria miniovina]KAK0717556.1 hypothetical protein B0T26DRAFT_675841 [Lasiosphaeria miniovina]
MMDADNSITTNLASNNVSTNDASSPSSVSNNASPSVNSASNKNAERNKTAPNKDYTSLFGSRLTENQVAWRMRRAFGLCDNDLSEADANEAKRNKAEEKHTVPLMRLPIEMRKHVLGFLDVYSVHQTNQTNRSLNDAFRAFEDSSLRSVVINTLPQDAINRAMICIYLDRLRTPRAPEVCRIISRNADRTYNPNSASDRAARLDAMVQRLDDPPIFDVRRHVARVGQAEVDEFMLAAADIADLLKCEKLRPLRGEDAKEALALHYASRRSSDNYRTALSRTFAARSADGFREHAFYHDEHHWRCLALVEKEMRLRGLTNPTMGPMFNEASAGFVVQELMMATKSIRFSLPST